MSISGIFGYLWNYIKNEYYTTPKKLRYLLFGFGFIIGIGTTTYGHIGRHPYIIELLPLIAGYNPILGLYGAFGFMIGDLLVKPFEETTIPWFLFFIVHVGIVIYTVLPPLFSRAFVYFAYSMGVLKRDGGVASPQLGPLIVSAIGGLIGVGLGLKVIDSAMQYAYVETPPIFGSEPDYSCLSMARSEDMFTGERVSTVTLFSGPIGGLINNLVGIGYIPSAGRLFKGESPKVEVPSTVSKRVKKVSKGGKAVKSVASKVKKVKAVKTLRKVETSSLVDTIKGYVDRATKIVTDFVMGGEWQPINLNFTSNLLTLTEYGLDKFFEYVDRKYVSKRVKAFKEVMRRWAGAMDELDLAKRDYTEMLKKVKIKGNRVIKPKGYSKAANNYMSKLRRVKRLAREGRLLQKEIKSIRRAKSFTGGLFKWIGNVLFAKDVAADLVTYHVDDGKTIVESFVKSFATNYAVTRVVDVNPVGFATMELVNEVAFDNSEAAEIISPTNFIKNEAKFVYDLGETLLKEKSLSKAWSKVRNKVLKGEYGKLIKHVYSGFEELREYMKDPTLVREVLENKGLSAGLKGVEDKAGKFYDGIHKRIDEVFKVSKKSWRITKFAAASVRKVLHGWTNLVEFGHRTITSLTGWFRG